MVKHLGLNTPGWDSLRKEEERHEACKKGGFACLLVCLFALNVQAQVGLKLGIKGGLSYGDVSLEVEGEDIDTEHRTGGIGGIFLECPINEYLSIQPEFLYVGKGCKYEESGTVNGYSYSGEGKARVHYLEIPVLARVNVPLEQAPVKPFFCIGPYFAFKVGSHYDLEATADGVSYSESGDIEDLKSYDIGLCFGGGVEIRNFVVDIRYDLGLTNISDEDDIDVKTRTWLFTVGYKFDLF